MLENLDKIPWDRIDNAYGFSDATPEHIRNLTSQDEHAREEAVEYFWSAVIHQGTIYQVTSYTIPFLLEIIYKSSTPNSVKREILWLISSFLDSASQITENQGQEKQKDEFAGNYGVCYKHKFGERIKAAALSGIDQYLAFLSDGDEEIREAVPFVLSFLDAEKSKIFPALKERIKKEKNDRVLTALILNLLVFEQKKILSALEMLINKDIGMTPKVVIAALIAVYRKETTPKSIVDLLVDYLADYDYNEDYFESGSLPLNFSTKLPWYMDDISFNLFSAVMISLFNADPDLTIEIALSEEYEAAEMMGTEDKEEIVEILSKIGNKTVKSQFDKNKREMDKNSEIRITAIKTLVEKKNPNDLVPALLQSLIYENPYVIRIAAEILVAKLGSEKALSYLREIVQHKDEMIRTITAQILGNIYSGESVEVLKLFLNDNERFVRRNAIISLGRIGAQKELDFLLEYFDREESFNQDAIIEAMGAIGTEKAYQIAIEELSNSDTLVRWQARKLLVNNPDITTKMLITALESKNDLVKQNIITSSEGITDNTNPMVIETLKYQSSLIRTEIVRILGKIGSIRAIKAIKKALNHEDWTVRWIAEETLDLIN
ncbi:MAG: HEAT repeat domain-containing protein [Candidatus Hodarchaeota archaeon]